MQKQRAKEEGVKAMWMRWHGAVRWTARLTRHVGAASHTFKLCFTCFQTVLQQAPGLLVLLWK